MNKLLVVSNIESTTTQQSLATSTEKVTTTGSGLTQEDGGGGERSRNDIRSGPYIDVGVSRNVTALLGKTAFLNCRVRNLGNKTVSFQVIITSRILTSYVYLSSFHLKPSTLTSHIMSYNLVPLCGL